MIMSGEDVKKAMEIRFDRAGCVTYRMPDWLPQSVVEAASTSLAVAGPNSAYGSLIWRLTTDC
jgi:hypothetical protein